MPGTRPTCTGHCSHPTQPGMLGSGAPGRPRVMTPPLSAKNRPFSRGPDKQGVTPTTRVGALRGRPSNLRFFTQPLNHELLTATCGGAEGWTLGQKLHWLAGLGTGRGRWAGDGGGDTGLRRYSLGAGACGRWQVGRPQRVCGAGGPPPLDAAGQALHGPGPRLRLAPAGSESSAIAQTPGGGVAHQGMGLPGPRHALFLSPLPCATGQSVNAGGSGHGAGALSLLSEQRSVGDSGRVSRRGRQLSGGQPGAGAPGGCEGGPALRGVTWKPSRAISLGSHFVATQPGLALPVPSGCWDACKLQVTGQGTPKLVGVSHGPEGPGHRAGGVLGVLQAAPGGLWGQTEM